MSLSIYSPVVAICTTNTVKKFHVLPTQCIYVFYVDLRTNRLFPYTTLTDFYNRDGVFTARYGLGLYV